MHTPKAVNFEAYFLGPKGENAGFYKRLLLELLEDHIDWRQAFHSPDSIDFITDEDKRRNDFLEAQHRIEEKLLRLRELLKKNQPFFSPRYIGHMNWEVMAAPILAFFAAALYNPNNVAKAGSTGTSELELEVGRDFVRMFGFDQSKGWGHICAGGTIANMEALWIARNMKFIPIALKKMLVHFGIKHKPVFVGGEEINLSEIADEELIRRFNPDDILQLRDSILEMVKKETDKQNEIDDFFEKISFQAKGFDPSLSPGLVFVPQTAHYSLKKAIDLLGLGWDSMRFVPVNDKFRMDMDQLKTMIETEAKNHPILAVVGVLGSTEESAVDEIHEIIKIRKQLHKEMAVGFHIHVDAAYGGYAMSLFLNEENQFMEKVELDRYLKEFSIIGDKPEREYASWPAPEVFKAYRALHRVDTITIDPHKLGYVLYPAGGIVLRDKRMREAIQTFAPYVFPKPKPGETDELIGAYILEGSKPGAAAAAVWLAHRIMPLNITGYGKLIGETIDGAQALWYALEHAPVCKIDNEIKVCPHALVKPDLNIVNYVFNFVGNTNLVKMNRLTQWIYNELLNPIPDSGGLILEKYYIVSITNFNKKNYSDVPILFLEKIGIPQKEWDKVGEMDILRSVVMSPYLTPDYVDENYVEKFVKVLYNQIIERKHEIKQIYYSL